MKIKVFALLLCFIGFISVAKAEQTDNETLKYYYTTVLNLVGDKDFYKEVAEREANLGISGLYSSMLLHNFNIFKDSEPCKLNVITNYCFNALAKSEAELIILQDIAEVKGYVFDTKPFYKWKEAVLVRENLGNDFFKKLLGDDFFNEVGVVFAE